MTQTSAASAGSEKALNPGALPSAQTAAKDPAATVRAFRESMPEKTENPLSDGNLKWLEAILACLEEMDERIYEHYRAMIDLFRRGIFRAPREDLTTDARWDSLREKAVRMGILPEDLYGTDRPEPHVGIPEVWERIRKTGVL